MKRNKPKKSTWTKHDKQILATFIIYFLAVVAVIIIGVVWTVMEFMIRFKILFG